MSENLNTDAYKQAKKQGARERAIPGLEYRLRNGLSSYRVRADELFRIGNAYEIIYEEDRPLKGSFASFTSLQDSQEKEKG